MYALIYYYEIRMVDIQPQVQDPRRVMIIDRETTKSKKRFSPRVDSKTNYIIINFMNRTIIYFLNLYDYNY